jgi:uncharacterized membrane protein YkoI
VFAATLERASEKTVKGPLIAISRGSPTLATGTGNRRTKDSMRRPAKLAIGIAALVVAAGAGGAYAWAGGGDDDATDTPITGTDLQKASAAALAETGGGRVTGTEVGDEESYYEVEVTLDGGGQVDIQLDESFNVVGSEGDGDGSGED